MRKIIACSLLLCLVSCDQGTQGSSAGSIRGIRLDIAARRASGSPDSLRLSIAVDGQNPLEYRALLDSARGTDVLVPFGAQVRIQARVFSYGDTTQTCDTSFAMPSTPDVQVALKMLAVVFPATTLSRQPRTQATLGSPFLDTLALTGQGADSTAISLASGPAGMVLTGNILSWTPLDTGTVQVRVAFAYHGRTDTLGWTVAVGSPSAPPGMVWIHASGIAFLFGSGIDSSVVPTRVSLAHDFEMDQTEVPQRLYDSVMSRGYPNEYVRPPWTAALGLGDSMPAYFVSFYDAALFCNERSKLDGLDTVFSYSTRIWAKGVVYLFCLKLRQNVRGYRLPTEAEWDFAARGNSDSLHFWKTVPGAVQSRYANYPSSSGSGKLQDCGLTVANGYGLHDMFGNVAEMVLGLHISEPFVPQTADPWGPGIWDWSDANTALLEVGAWPDIVLRGGDCSSTGERRWAPADTLLDRTGFRSVLPASVSGQGAMLPGLVPAAPFAADSTFTVKAGSSLTVHFILWDVYGQAMTISVQGAGFTALGSSVVWNPTMSDVGLHRVPVTATTSDGRSSTPFQLVVQVQ
jgi:formylglycine-generating enzyme required for sulfatase activity